MRAEVHKKFIISIINGINFTMKSISRKKKENFFPASENSLTNIFSRIFLLLVGDTIKKSANKQTQLRLIFDHN